MHKISFLNPIKTQGFVKLVYTTKIMNPYILNYPVVMNAETLHNLFHTRTKVFGFNMRNELEKTLEGKQDIDILFYDYVELIKIGRITKKNWSCVTHLIEPTYKKEIEESLNTKDNNECKIKSFEVIIWTNNKHRIVYNKIFDCFEVRRND